VPARQARLDAVLALGQPVQRRVELVLVGAGDVELVGQRRAAQGARAGQLGPRLDQPLARHRHHQRARATARDPAAAPPSPRIAVSTAATVAV
jgi:hypothetical protein